MGVRVKSVPNNSIGRRRCAPQSMLGVALPGFSSPAAGFEQPFAMLDACHERVRRSLGLLQRLIEHLDRRGQDQQSVSAARDVLRYFDLAAPHHHEDEERHVFPLLLVQAQVETTEMVERLQREHRQMSILWARLRLHLQQWAAESPVAAASVSDEARQQGA